MAKDLLGTEQGRDELVALLGLGWTQAEIASGYGVSRQRVGYVLGCHRIDYEGFRAVRRATLDVRAKARGWMRRRRMYRRPGRWEAQLTRNRKRHADRMANDPVYRRRLRRLSRVRDMERRRSDPAYRARRNARARARYHRQGGESYARWRGTLLLEQGFACGLCGETITAETAHVDHIVPVSKGGGNEKANLQATCPACNLAKGNRTAA